MGNPIDPAETTIGVVGAGNMGAGIAQKYATEGFTVIVVDLTDEAAKAGQARVTETLAEGVERKIFKPEQRDAILGRMSFTADKGALKDAALVVEAIFENKAVKQSLFKELDGICGPQTLLATNTSSFFVDDVAADCQHKDRVLGLHYFYHPAKNRLVEVIKGKATSDAAAARAWRIQELTGKNPIESADAPGFVVNRFFVPWLNESMRIVEEGVADIATVEAAAKQTFGVGMGPFELMNVTGVPITLHAATTLGEQLGPFYAPCNLIRPVVEAKENWDLSGEADPAKIDTVADRLWGVVCQIAVRIVFDEKVCTLEDCDLGARVGLRWPMGPFEAMNAMGVPAALKRVEALAARYTDVEVPAALKKQKGPWHLELVSARVEGDLGIVTLNRPDAMNALNETVVEQLGAAFKKVSSNDAVKGIIIEGKGKAFVAGADTRFFVDRIENDDVERIVRFASGGQDLFRAIDLSEKTVVCKLDGLSLGGGSELALACDYVVATPAGSLGFPETGIGIYPGLGGTQRTARRVGVPLARWLVLSGQGVGAKEGQVLGLVDEIAAASEIDETCARFARDRRPREESAPPSSPPAGYETVWKAFEGEALPSTSDDEAFAKVLKRIGFKAPLAVKAADELLLAARSNTLAEGLKAETAGLEAIFRSADALEGLSSIGRRRPAFKGA